MKNNKIAITYTTSIFVLTVVVIVISTYLFQNVSAQETTGTNLVNKADTTLNKTDNLKIGNLIYENKGEITSQTVLEGPTVQTSFSSNGTILNGINSINGYLYHYS